MTTQVSTSMVAPDGGLPLAALSAAVQQLLVPTGAEIPFAGSSAPVGWLLEDGAAVSRVTYAALFAVVGTTYGAGDGSTTFNVPDARGRVPLGAGTGQDVEVVTSQAASGNAVPVASNTAKWITGRQVTVSGASGFTGLTNGAWFVVRASATTVQFAASLANAQNGTVATVTGTGSCTITATLTARTLGEKGGEEVHAMSSTELLAHTHTIAAQINAAGPSAGAQTYANSLNNGTMTTNTTGSSTAANIMQPYRATNWIIKT